VSDILDRFFHARAMAIIGASSDPEKIGGRPLRQCLELGFEGRIYPVNPSASEIQGLPSYASIADLPGDVDCALIALPAKGVEAAIDECAKKKIPLAIILSSGFAEASERGRDAQDRLLSRARAAGMRLIGPNSMGGISFETKISATFTSVNMHEGRGWPPLGGVSIASQSGFVGSHLLGMFRDRGLGLAKWLATGNQTDIDLADCIENFANDSITRTIAVYLEGAGRPDSLRWAFDIARANGKPIVALKAGRSDVGARAVASHTASLIGSNDAFEAVFRRHGVYEARTLDELVDVVAALDTGKRPRDNTVGVATVSGGFGILIADAAAHHGFELPELDRERQRTLREIYPLATTRNPVDVGSFAPFNAAIERLLDDVYGSVVLAIGHFGLMADRMDALHGALAAFRVDHPDTFISLVACLNEHWRRQFQQLGLFVCEDPARAVHAIAALRWLDERARLADDPIPAVAAIDPATLSARHDERTARDIVRAIGIPVVADTLVNTASEAIDAAYRRISRIRVT
jgi:acyl-CoA synthetase (NDP forming)